MADWESIGRLADSIDNMHAGMGVPGMPAHITIAALKEALPEWRDKLRAAYVEATGDNPWGSHPPREEKGNA